jgi:hypothetical protein
MSRTRVFRFLVVAALVTLMPGCGANLARPAASPLQVTQGVADDSLLNVRQYIYWTNNRNGTVGRANLNGTGVNQTFIPSTTGGAVGGAGMTVNKVYIYWTSANGGTATTILRARLDGTGLNPNFITGAHNPCGVTVSSRHIYWGGDIGTTIGRANLDGTVVRQKFITTGTGVCGVVASRTNIYWANYQMNWIGRANLNGSGVNLNFIPTVGADSLAIVGAYIYWDNSNGTIGRANVDGTGVNENFITGLNGQTGFIAADRAHIYWTNWSGGAGTTIGRANISGTGVNQTFITGTSGGFGIAVTAGSP